MASWMGNVVIAGAVSALLAAGCQMPSPSVRSDAASDERAPAATNSLRLPESSTHGRYTSQGVEPAPHCTTKPSTKPTPPTPTDNPGGDLS